MNKTKTAATEEVKVVICYPVHGCEAARPMTEEEMAVAKEKSLRAIQKHWGNDGVKAIIELVEVKAAVLQARCTQEGSTQHVAGQAYGMQQLVGELQRLRWSEAR